MDKKKIIGISIIVVMLGSSLFLIYKNFLTVPKVSVGAADSSASAAAESASLKVLPYGQSLDFSLLHQYNADGRIFNYPEVDASQVGVGISELVKPAPSTSK